MKMKNALTVVAAVAAVVCSQASFAQASSAMKSSMSTPAGTAPNPAGENNPTDANAAPSTGAMKSKSSMMKKPHKPMTTTGEVASGAGADTVAGPKKQKIQKIASSPSS